MKEPLQLILGLFALVSVIGGFLYWHFKTLNSFKDQITELKLSMKELENRDNLQQLTIDQLKELYPILKQVFKNINKAKK